jgi:hypothetical protein
VEGGSVKIKCLGIHGIGEALFGLGLSYGLTSVEGLESPLDAEIGDKLVERSYKLAPLDGGHNKFLESVQVWLLIQAPRYWWQEFDTYRVGVTKQSESTIHTLMKRQLTPDDFEGDCVVDIINLLNAFITKGDFEAVKRHLPESFLQTRMVNVNCKALRHIVAQRKGHKLQEWKYFINAIRELQMVSQWIFKTKKEN